MHFSLFENANTHAIAQTYDTWKSQDNSISIRYDHMPSLGGIACIMYIIKDKKQAHTQFKITDIPKGHHCET